MKKTINKFLIWMVLSSAILSCSEQNPAENETNSHNQAVSKTIENSRDLNQDHVVLKSSAYEKFVTKPLVRNKTCRYIIEGTVEYRLNGKTIAVVDYGDGVCDDIATKTVNRESKDIKLSGKKRKKQGKGKNLKFVKNITKPLVKLENCEYVVEGTIEYLKEDEVVAKVDFGNGLCDDIATKTINGETKEFKLRDKKRGRRGERWK